MQANRRQVFAALLAAAAARHVNAADDIAIPGKRPMILHNDRPEDLETPVKYFDSWVTPIDAFFVRQHLPRPAAVEPAAYRLNITGLVSRQLQVTLADLEKQRRAAVRDQAKRTSRQLGRAVKSVDRTAHDLAKGADELAKRVFMWKRKALRLVA